MLYEIILNSSMMILQNF